MATKHHDQQTPKTYVLIGDHFEGSDGPIYKDRDDVILIRAKEGQSIEDAVKEIAPPANIVLAAHGEKDGTFMWNRGGTYTLFGFVCRIAARRHRHNCH